MMQFVTPLSPLHKILASMWDEDNYKRFSQPFSIPAIDIVFTKDGICILTNIVIVDPMCANIFLRSFTTQRFVAFDVIQTKERNYYDQHPTDQFLSLAIEVFECLHKQANVFLHKCANAIWSLKG